jgi:hypothetical protein
LVSTMILQYSSWHTDLEENRVFEHNTEIRQYLVTILCHQLDTGFPAKSMKL